MRKYRVIPQLCTKTGKPVNCTITFCCKIIKSMRANITHYEQEVIERTTFLKFDIVKNLNDVNNHSTMSFSTENTSATCSALCQVAPKCAKSLHSTITPLPKSRNDDNTDAPFMSTFFIGSNSDSIQKNDKLHSTEYGIILRRLWEVRKRTFQHEFGQRGNSIIQLKMFYLYWLQFLSWRHMGFFGSGFSKKKWPGSNYFLLIFWKPLDWAFENFVVVYSKKITISFHKKITSRSNTKTTSVMV